MGAKDCACPPVGRECRLRLRLPAPPSVGTGANRQGMRNVKHLKLIHSI
jgi:hypothetical protein